ncbi:hypothetical protein DCO58_05715 [Helicobacter saguini]|uniref:PhzF family phenazine biosynthesis protein n=1 Tax=Helicobacter saguini TaxID=1548018 RepID=A0A347VTC3_9HELI|nr:PhzF family phenazine biosynthesis protein [Helicobacter saguini]MWV67172.1 hypothetical protein [Helicobacter saguini]MWV69524.1 hypothetical protein [Helicobacter saguini]MWV70925.1 hypothetical protein [Helicobacter saguini]TLD92537.1 hypothetical protein LS64_010120 [Helicobacter saguini]
MLQYVVDSFSDRIFGGNPAAVVVCDRILNDCIMQKIAIENNLSESAFLFVGEDSKDLGANLRNLDSKNIADFKALEDSKNTFELRFFTPKNEIDLCGHATLASSFVVMNLLKSGLNKVHFRTKGGLLSVSKKHFNNKELFEMDFPIFEMSEVAEMTQIREALKPLKVLKVLKGRDLLCIVDNALDVIEFVPDLGKIAKLDGLLLHISASLDSQNYMESKLQDSIEFNNKDSKILGNSNLDSKNLLTELKNKKVDCISRTFAPKCGVSEDPVCGSGHCHIAPFWAKILDKDCIIAYQASSRGGYLYTKMLWADSKDSIDFIESNLQDSKTFMESKQNRILISGEATLFSKAEIFI